MDNTGLPLDLGSSDQLGPPPNAGPLICWRAGEQVCTMEQAREYAARAAALERERCAALVASVLSAVRLNGPDEL